MTGKQRLLWLAIGAGLAFVLVCASCGGFFVIAASLGGASDLAIGPAVAIVRVEGIIASGSPPIDPFGTPSGAYSGLVVDHLRQAEEDSNVKAVVLRVDSPGGSVVGSDEIYRQVLVMTKPVVVSMGELAASGGYARGIRRRSHHHQEWRVQGYRQPVPLDERQGKGLLANDH
jgi:protease-4